MAQSKLETHYCINCGKEAIEQHHIIPLALGGNNIESNKVWLCSECHAVVHNFNKNNRGTRWRELQAVGIAKAKLEGKYKKVPDGIKLYDKNGKPLDNTYQEVVSDVPLKDLYDRKGNKYKGNYKKIISPL